MKRFTETAKWEDPWFRALTPKHKCLWVYLCDRCDNAGVIDVDWGLASFSLGCKVSRSDLVVFSRQVEVLPCGKVWLRKFIVFQCGNLSAECPAHKPIFASIARHGLGDRVSKGYQYPTDNLQEKEKDKDKEEDTEKETDARDLAPVAPELALFEIYPRREGKLKALESIRKALTVKPEADLREAVTAYAAAVAQWPAADRAQFVPHPATWFNQGRYDDDRTTWQRSGINGHQAAAPARLGLNLTTP